MILGDDFEAERTLAVKELIAGLESYAEWCSSKQVWLERNRALLAVLSVDPGNMAAKRGLGWQQVADGVWEPPKDPKPAKNYDLAALKEAPARYGAAIQPWRDHLMRLLEEYRANLTPGQRESVYAEILSIDPDDGSTRAARGEAKSERGWVLAQTVSAKSRRAEIRGIVKSAFEDVPPPADVKPGPDDLSFKVNWKTAVATDRVRVLSSGERAEAVRAATVLHATRDVFNRTFGCAADLGEGFTVYLLCDPASKSTFIENFPNLTPAQRSFYGQVDGTGMIGSSSAAWWSPTADRRLDGITRHAYGWMLLTELGVGVDVAWAWEGLGLYLTRETIGTRLTWYIVPVEENATAAAKRVGPDWMKKLLTPGTNWMNEGYRLVRAGEGQSLSVVLSHPMNKLTPQDLFVSYVTGAYLLEAEPMKVTALLRALGSRGKAGSKAQQAWPATLGIDVIAFFAHLERWLGERR